MPRLGNGRESAIVCRAIIRASGRGAFDSCAWVVLLGFGFCLCSAESRHSRICGFCGAPLDKNEVPVKQDFSSAAFCAAWCQGGWRTEANSETLGGESVFGGHPASQCSLFERGVFDSCVWVVLLGSVFAFVAQNRALRESAAFAFSDGRTSHPSRSVRKLGLHSLSTISVGSL